MECETESNTFLKSRKSRNVVFVAFKLSNNSWYRVVIASSVELLALKPNCAGVKMFVLINILILSSKIFFSNNLKSTDRREIGLDSFSDLGEETLGIGIT